MKIEKLKGAISLKTSAKSFCTGLTDLFSYPKLLSVRASFENINNGKGN